MFPHVQPEAPLPPPPPHMGMHHGAQQLPADMARMNLHHTVPQYNSQGNSYVAQLDGRYTPQGPALTTQLPYLGNRKVPITYEGWSFTRQAPSKVNEKATWALVVKTKMPLSQDELRNQVAKRKKKGKTVTEQYHDHDMDGFKKKQVDRLIADRTRSELDPRFEYKLASLKLEQGRTRQGSRQTTSMQIILKRVYRSGDEQPLGSGQERAQELEGEVVDLTGTDDAAYSHSGYSSSSQGLYGAQSYPGYVNVQPQDEQPYAPYFPDQGPGIEPVHHDEIGVKTARIYEEPHMPQGNANQQQHPEPQEHHHYHDQQTPDKKEKKDKSDKKDSKPEVHQNNHGKHKSGSDSSSDSDAGSSLYTDRTPDTEYSGHSAHAYHKEKKHSSSRKSSRRDSRSHDHDLSPVRQVYRERRRKSPARSTNSGSEYGVYEVITSDGHRDRPYKTARTYMKERPVSHQRALSYDDDSIHRPAYRQKRLNSYAHPVVDEHPHEEAERLRWEIERIQREKSEDRRREREKAKLESDRLERQKLELEIERLRFESERQSHARLDRTDRYAKEDRYNRDDRDDRYDPRDRYNRDDRYDQQDRYDRGRYDLFVDRERERPRRFSTAAYDTRRDDLYYR